jgi:ABC-type transport system substrate-binding protein
MRRSALVLALAGAMAVAAASASPKQAPPAPPAATVTARTSEVRAPVQIRWLDTYGTFDAHRGKWNFFPTAEGC